MAMHKSELVKSVAEEAGLSKVDAGRAVDAVIAVVPKQVAAGNTVNITGFGKFTLHASKARKGRNPQTGAEITIAARNTPKFAAGQALKDSCN